MKRISVLVFLFVLSVFSIQAQGKRQIEYSGFFDSYYYRGPISYTVGAGIASYRGDLTNNGFNFNLAPTFSVGANYKTWPRTAFGAEFSYTMLSAQDSDADRNMEFSGTIMSFGAYGRFYLIDDVIRNARDRNVKPRLFKPYLAAGINYINYKATASYAGATNDTIGDEGIGYPRSGIAIPATLGFQWAISNKVAFITELQYNFTFTDYLDAVSQRGDPNSNDGFACVNFKLQICPSAPGPKKKQSLPPPAKYEGPKGTETWKTRKAKEKSERPARQEYYIPGENPEENPDENQDAPAEGDGASPEEQAPVDGEQPMEESTPEQNNGY